MVKCRLGEPAANPSPLNSTADEALLPVSTLRKSFRRTVATRGLESAGRGWAPSYVQAREGNAMGAREGIARAASTFVSHVGEVCCPADGWSSGEGIETV